MKGSMKFVGAATLAILGLGAAGLAAGEAGAFGGEGRLGRGGHVRGRHGFGRVAQALNLTEEQKAQLKEMRAKQRESLKPLVEQQRALREQIRQALESASPDATRIGQLQIEAHRLREQFKAEQVKMREAFVSVLTPEQKATWDSLQAQRQQKREQLRQKREQLREKRGRDS